MWMPIPLYPLPRRFRAAWLLRVVAALAAVVLACSGAKAQNPRGTLRGTVVDATGAAFAGASVIASADATAIERVGLTGATGEFRLEDLPPGNYHVTAAASGFAPATAIVNVVVSQVRDVTVVLHPSPTQQSVYVTAQASSIASEPIDLASAVHQGAISSQDLETLPLANRTFANIAYLVPGTEPVEPSDPTKARITAVSFGGSSGLNVELSVDGGDNSDDYIGGFLQNYSPDAVQEFVVRTAQEDADTGRTTGGSVVITTRRGSDDWHGEGAVYIRAAALNARFPIDNPAPNPKQPFSRQNYIGTLGGPVKRDRVWFFSSFEYVNEKASIAYSPASLTQFNALASFASEGLIPGVSSIDVPPFVSVPFYDYLGTLRFDWAQSARSEWFIRAATDRYTTFNDLVQQASLPSTGATSRSNYLNLLVSQHYTFSPTWLGSLVLEASGLHRTETRTDELGFALAFPFTSTASTISGYETLGDNQFVTPITAFPVLRNQQKYQVRYDLSHTTGSHAPRFGVNWIHEPVMSGALTGTAESFSVFPLNPTAYVGNPQQFTADLTCTAVGNVQPTPGSTCTDTPASNGRFDQGLDRLGLYVEDSWRITRNFTFNYGLRYDTTFGLFTASGRSQLENPTYITLQALGINLIPGAPHDYRHAFAPRIGIAYSPGSSQTTVFRAGFGLYYNDLAQNGWVNAFQAVNAAPGPCTDPFAPPGPENAGCIPGAAFGGAGAIIAPNYKTPYAVHATAGFEHAFSANWLVSADYTHEQGNHAYRGYNYNAGYTLFTPQFPESDFADQQAYVPDISVYRSDNRSSYNGLSIHLQGNVSRRFNLIANYTLSKAQTWGCVLGELFDYVNGVCNPLNPFGPGDYGPSGEDVRHRFVLAGTLHAPGGFEITTLSQFEGARPITLTTPVDVNGLGDTADDRAVVNGVQTSLDELRGTPYIQVDLRVSRPIHFGERVTAIPFIEFFNLFNRNNPGANYVTNVAALPVPQNQLANLIDICLDPACTQLQPITSLKQLRQPAGALGDFFGPGTTVGIPFAAQLGFRLTF
jgi:Carboxypeptidase regulatory-like domain/TonB dependent receptor